MTNERSPRPPEQFAAAIYESVQLSPSDDPQALALEFRDRLTQLAELGNQHRDFIAYCVHGSPAAAPGEVHAAVTDAFRSARGALQGEQLAARAVADIHRQLDEHLRRISRALAQEFLTGLEHEVDAGRIGQMQRVGESIGRCTLPARSLGRQFPDPLAAMMASSDEEEEAPSTTGVEFFIDRDVLLTDLGRRDRQLRPLRLIMARATPPLRRFLRLVAGKRYRAADDLAEGRFSAVVIFHYVLESWTDDAHRPSGSSRPRFRGLIERFRGLSAVRTSAISLVGLIVLAVAVIALDYRRATQVAALERHVATLEAQLTPPQRAEETTRTTADPETDPQQTAALERRLGAVEQRLQSVPKTADVDRLNGAIARLEQRIGGLEAKANAANDLSATLAALTERQKALEQRTAVDLQDLGLQIATLTERVKGIVRDATTSERATAQQRQAASDLEDVRNQMKRLNADLDTMRGDLASLRKSAATAERLATVEGKAVTDAKELRAELGRLDAEATKATKRLDALDTLLTGDTGKSAPSTVRNAAQMRLRVQHTPSQHVLDELHRLMRSEEPHEVANRSELLKERWKLLWSASSSLPYATRATMLLEEVTALAECDNLDNSRYSLVRDECKRLSELTPEGDLSVIDALVALTIRAKTFGDKCKGDYPYAKSDVRKCLANFIAAVGQHVDKQRLVELGRKIGQAGPSPNSMAQTK